MSADLSPITDNKEPQPLYTEHPDFNQWLDAEDDGVNLAVREDLKFTHSASWIAYSMDEVFYQSALNEYRSRQEAEFKERIRRSFPTPIAFYFHRAEHGYQNDMQRLFLLKDTWEALIFVLFAIVVGEARHRGITLQNRGLQNKDWYSDQIYTKLKIIKLILESAHENNVTLASQEFISDELLEQIRELNRYRNGFSHTAAKSEAQARELFALYFNEVLRICQAVASLRDITIIRYLGPGNIPNDPYSLRCEVFRGRDAGRVPHFEVVQLTQEQFVAVSSHLTVHTLLVQNGEYVYPLSPFLCYEEDDDGHSTKLLVYKQKSEHHFTYEIVGHSAEVHFDRQLFDRYYNDLQRLLQ